jgi:hypothetical protein
MGAHWILFALQILDASTIVTSEAAVSESVVLFGH